MMNSANALSLEKTFQTSSTLTKSLSWVVAITIGVALMSIAAKIKVDFIGVPLTFQMLALFLIGATYGARMAFVTLMAYLACGVNGMSVFANTPPQVPSLAYFFGPTGGYLIAYPFAVALIGWVSERGFAKNPFVLFTAMIAGGALVYCAGGVWLAFFATLSSGDIGLGIQKTWLYGVQPFLLPDLAKAGLAACLVPAGWALLQKLFKPLSIK